MTLHISVDELADASDLDLGVTAWHLIEQQRVDTFADATDDHQWIHVDPQRSADGPFGGTIAHGYLILSLVPALLKELLKITDHGRGINYGLEKMRFTTPVAVGSEVRLVGAIPKATRREDGGVQYWVSLKIEIKGEERPAMVGESIYLVYPRR